MKIKLFFLLLAATFLTYVIYISNNNQRYDILSIYDQTTMISPNYNDYLKEKLNNINYTYNEKYIENNLEIQNVIANIKINRNKIQEAINNSEIIIIHLGDFELLRENISLTNLLLETEELFQEIKKINHKQIIFITPLNIKSNYLYKDLCHKYKIYYLNTSNYLNSDDYLNNIIQDKGHQKVANWVYQTITDTWNIDKK